MKTILLLISVIFFLGYTLNAQVENKPETKVRKEKVKFEKRLEQPIKHTKENTVYEKNHKKELNVIKKSKAIREEKKKK